MTRLQVETTDFRDAATTMRHDVAESVRICLEGLNLTPELVGEDPAGEAWSAAYDPAARTVLRATAHAVDAAAGVSVLFAHSGHNYARAEAASTPGGGHEAEFAELLRPLPTVTPPSMPRSGGAGNGTPAGWWLVEHTVGLAWPGGHQDRLRTTASEWRSAANGIEHVAFDPVVSASVFARDRLPEADDIATVCAGLNRRLTDLARSYRALADACESYADHLDECHDAVRDELSDLLRDSGIAQASGAALAFFTLGGSEVAAQGAEAGRVAAAAVEVESVIQRLITAGRRIAEVVDRAHHVAQEIDSALSPLLDLRAVDAGVTNAARLPRTSTPRVNMSPDARREAVAAGRIAAGVRVKRPLNAAERRHILDGDERGGGHRHPNPDPRKSTFPPHWSDDRIIGNIEGIINSDDTAWRIDTGSGGIYTKRGTPAAWRAWEVREGIRIRVVWVPATGRVISAYPDPHTAPVGELIR